MYINSWSTLANDHACYGPVWGDKEKWQDRSVRSGVTDFVRVKITHFKGGGGRDLQLQ